MQKISPENFISLPREILKNPKWFHSVMTSITIDHVCSKSKSV